MTLSEFQAWLEGYSEAFTSGAPTAAQWAKIQEKLKSVKLVKTPEPVTTVSSVKKPIDWPPNMLRGAFVADEINPALVPKVTSQ